MIYECPSLPPPAWQRVERIHLWSHPNRVQHTGESQGATVVPFRYENNSPIKRIQEITL